MTAWSWLLLSAVPLCLAGPSAPLLRLDRLARQGRLGEWSASGRSRLTPSALTSVATVAGVVGVAVAVTLLRGVVLGGTAAAVALSGALAVRDLRRRRASSAERVARLAAVRVLVAELAAGARPASALSAAAGSAADPAGGGGRAARVFGEAARVAAAGGDAGVVLATEPPLRPVGLAWQLGESAGAALADVLARVAADLAAADEQARAVGVALAGPRSSALLLTLLPVVGLAMGTAMGAHPVGFLSGSPSGQVACCLGVGLDLAGLAWVRRILRSAVQT